MFTRFFQALKGSLLCSPWSDLVKFRTRPSLYGTLLTGKMKKIRSKKGARVFTTLYINFSDAQGQVTLELVVVSSKYWNSSKLSCMSSLPTRMKLIHTKMKQLERSQDFSHYKYMGIFFRRSRAANSAVLGRIWPKFELVRDLMVVLVTCKYEEDRTKYDMFTTFCPL